MSKTFVRWTAVAVVALAALAGGFYFGQRTPDEPSAAPLLGMTLPDVDGRDQQLEQWRGKVLVVNFWATWCEPCREEMPEFIKTQARLGDKGLQFIGIAIDQPDKIRKFSSELGVNYPSLVGGYGALELSKSLGNRLMALPFSLVIDRQGRVVHTQLGPLKPDKLASIISKLL